MLGVLVDWECITYFDKLLLESGNIHFETLKAPKIVIISETSLMYTNRLVYLDLTREFIAAHAP